MLQKSMQLFKHCLKLNETHFCGYLHHKLLYIQSPIIMMLNQIKAKWRSLVCKKKSALAASVRFKK